MACCNLHKRKKLMRQIAGFIKSLFLNIKSGFKHVSNSDYKDRIDICKACHFLNHKENRCTDCGCYVVVKARLKVEDCPQGYWKKQDTRVIDR